MMPVLSLLHSVPCPGSGLGCCDSAGGTCVFAEDGPPRVLSCQGDVSEAQEVVQGRDFRCNALALSSDGSRVLAGGHDGKGGLLLLITLSDPQAAVEVQLPAQEDDRPLPSITHVAKAADDVYAAAAGSYVYTVDADGDVTQSLGPLPAEVLDVRWAGGGSWGPPALVALTPSGCHVWPRGGAEGTSLTIPCPEGAMTALAATPAARFVAAACAGCKVRCWSVERLVAAAAAGEPPPPPLVLGSYDAPVRCLQWDGRGRYLATADGADCTVWDLSAAAAAAAASASQAVEVNDADSVMCCGHEPATHISCLAFQPGGRLLATLSNAGRLALFDARGFRRGGVAGPHATVAVGEDAPGAAGEGAARLAWLPGGRLLVSLPGAGRLVAYAVGAPEGGAGEGVLSPAGSSGIDTERESGSGSLTQACTSVEYTSSPLTPAQGSGEATELFDEEFGGSGPAPAALPAVAEGEEGPAGGAVAPPPSEPPGARAAAGAAPAEAEGSAEEGAAPARPAPRPIRTGVPRPEEGGEGPLQRPPTLAPLAVPDPEGSAPRSARTRGGRRGGSAGAGAGSAPASARGAMSAADAALLEHIQQLRESPAAGRKDQGEELTGWGLGVMGGGAPAAPWAAGQPPAAGAPAVAYAPGYGAVPVQYMQYPQYQQAMMNAAAAAAAQGMAHMGGMAALPPSPHAPGAGAYAVASPRGSGGLGPAQGAPMMVPGAGGGWAAMAAPGGYPRQAQHAQHAMQAQQQWAGVAPGYMAYQHGVAAYGMPGAGAAPPPPPPPMAYSPAAPRQYSGGPGSPVFGSAFAAAIAAQNNAEVGPDSARSGASAAGASTAERQQSDADAAEANNNDGASSSGTSRRRRQRGGGGGGGGSSKGSGSSGLSSAAADAAMAAVAAAAAAREPRPPASPSPAPSPSSPAAAAAASPRRRPATVPLPPPPDIDPDASATVYLGHLPPAVDENVLAWTCAHFGPVSHAQIIRDKATHVSRGYGFVTFAHPAYATVAMQQLNGQVMWGPFGGQRIRAAPTNKRGGGPPPG